METLGSLCDKLSIVKLKQYHVVEDKMAWNLAIQEADLMHEINAFVADAICGNIPKERLCFAANKIYKKQGNEIHQIPGNDLGFTISELAIVNIELWHEQEKVYETNDDHIIQSYDARRELIKKLSILNLKRNMCIDKINDIFKGMIK